MRYSKLGDSVAAEMGKILSDSDFKSVFASPEAKVDFEGVVDQDPSYKAFVRIASKKEDSEALALKHIVETISTTSAALDNMGLEKSATVALSLLNGIINEASAKKLADTAIDQMGGRIDAMSPSEIITEMTGEDDPQLPIEDGSQEGLPMPTDPLAPEKNPIEMPPADELAADDKKCECKECECDPCECKEDDKEDKEDKEDKKKDKKDGDDNDADGLQSNDPRYVSRLVYQVLGAGPVFNYFEAQRKGDDDLKFSYLEDAINVLNSQEGMQKFINALGQKDGIEAIKQLKAMLDVAASRRPVAGPEREPQGWNTNRPMMPEGFADKYDSGNADDETLDIPEIPAGVGKPKAPVEEPKEQDVFKPTWKEAGKIQDKEVVALFNNVNKWLNK